MSGASSTVRFFGFSGFSLPERFSNGFYSWKEILRGWKKPEKSEKPRGQRRSGPVRSDFRLGTKHKTTVVPSKSGAPGCSPQ
jgi:hypothetical protein